jgi:sulfur carrier protein
MKGAPQRGNSNCERRNEKLLSRSHAFRKSEVDRFGPAGMKLKINGEERSLDEAPTPFTLAALVEILGMKADRVAVELNRDIVPRDLWVSTQLAENDQLEIVHFVGGGLKHL